MKILAYLSQALNTVTRHQRSVWKYAFIIVITFFLAKALNLLIAHYKLPLELAQQARGLDSSETRTNEKKADISKILSRNIFDSEAKSRFPATRGDVNTGQIVPSSLPLELMGTIVFQTARFSVALVRDRNSKSTQYYAIGDTVQSARVHKIERFRVILENGSRLESLELKAAESKLGGTASFKPFGQPEAQPGASAAFDELGPGRFAIPQRVVDDALNNFSQILTQARMVPNLTPDNKTDGFKVFQIKSGSIYEKLGMKDGDIIKRVNGAELDSFEKATGLFTALRNEKSISIDLVRNGQRINYTYEIR
jgi:general secretion pathway protein C